MTDNVHSKKHEKSAACRPDVRELEPEIGSFSHSAANKFYRPEEAEQLPLLDLPPTTQPCARCGAPFVGGNRLGRPQAYCSDECRAGQKYDQTRAWEAANASTEDRRASVACRICGQLFTPPAATAGRLPRFCSKPCRLAAHRVRLVEARERRRRRPFRQSETRKDES